MPEDQSQLPTEPRISLIGRRVGIYQLVRELGRGGMGEVYLAHDPRLGRHVALKMLPSRFTDDVERVRRFQREARAASSLNHPNIVTIFDIGQEDGRHYIVTEFIEGQTLRSLINDGRMSFRQVLDFAIQIAGALTAAHNAGIVHRDIKPENILVRSDGYVKVLDFGLAKLTEPESMPSEGETGDRCKSVLETSSGVILGTFSHMSPEQARGLRVDGRSDLFSLGVVLYELITCERPFTGLTPNHVLVAILDEEPPPLADKFARPGLQCLLNRALAKDREQRYQTSQDLQADLEELRRELGPQPGRVGLDQSNAQRQQGGASPTHEGRTRLTRNRPLNKRWLIVALAAMAVLVISVGIFFFFSRRAPLNERDTILLADFDNKTGEPVFDGTLKQALAVQLGQTPFLNILTEERVREALRLMKRSPDTPVARDVAREICQRQGLKALLIGSIASLGSTYVVTLEAINGQSGEALASQQTEAASKEKVLGALGQAASRLRAGLGESLRSMERFDTKLEQATTSSLEALKAYSLAVQEGARGRHLEAISLYNHAVELDSSFALAYSHLSRHFASIAHPEQAAEAAQKAFALRDRVTEREKFSIDETYYATITEQLDKLIETLETWARTYPSDYYPHNSLATNHYKFARFEKALEEARASLRLNPNYAPARSNLAAALFRLNRFDEAKATIEETIREKLDSAAAHRNLYLMAALQGDAETMRRELDWLNQHSNEEWGLYLQAGTAGSAGELRQAQTLSRRAVELAAQHDFKELAATFASGQMLNEASCGLCRHIRQDAVQTLMFSRACFAQIYLPVLPNVTFALALCGEVGEAQRLADEMANRCPKATMVNAIYLPIIRATVELARGHAERAEQLLGVAAPYESTSGWGPTYVRGQAYLRLKEGRAAAAEFQRILDHPEWDLNTTFYPLAKLGLARANAMRGDATECRNAYLAFLADWKSADADLPVLIQAKKELDENRR